MSSPIVVTDAFLDILMANPDYFENNDIKIKLACNNYTPLRTSAVGNFTEAAGGGYALITLAANSHTIVNASTPHYLSWGDQSFIFTGPLTTNLTVYSYFVVDDAETGLLWAQLLDTSFVPTNNNDYIELHPCLLEYSTGVPA